LRLCVIFALKKISLAEVFGYTPVKKNIFIEPFSPFFTALLGVRNSSCAIEETSQ
jgi:hypothetical protein